MTTSHPVANSQNQSVNIHSKESKSPLEVSGIIGHQPQPKSQKFFMNGTNGLLGHSLFEELRNDHICIHTGETPHKFLGTINPKTSENIPMPSSTIKVLNSKTKPRTFKKQILSCDVIILNLMNCGNFDEVEYIIKALRQQAEENSANQSAKEQVLILVSNVLTWLHTPKKYKRNFPLKKLNDESDTEDDKSKIQKLREDESETEDDPLNPGNKVLYFTDSEFAERVPSPRYQQIKNLEMMAMAAAKFGKCLRVHVICGGLNYGFGEAQYLFYDFFRKAWLSLHPEHAALPIIGSGHNRIPTIHVKDLANCIKLVIENKFKQLYFLAVDMGKSTQEKIMKTIAEGIGSGAINQIDLSDAIEEDWCEFLTLDIKLRTSKVFTDANFWHCKKGICRETIGMLNQEFNFYRGLFPLKVFITGPPACGKTHYAQKLALQYGVPHIKIQDLVIAGYQRQDALGDEIRKKAEEIKDQTVADYDKTKKKKDPELDRNAIKVRLPDEILYKLLKYQMNTAACKNKGFILDGYPKNANDAKNIFLRKIENYQPPAEGQEVTELFPGFEINADIIPQFTILLQGEDPQLKQRVKELPPEKVLDTHYTDPHMDRRLKVYREQNIHDSGNSVQCFFSKAIGSDNVMIVHGLDNEPKNMQILEQFIEKNGKPCCLNMITEKDIKFLKKIEKRKKMQAEQPPEEHKDAAAEHEANQQPMEDDEEEDDLAKIIRKEEEDAKRREDEEKERKKQEAIEAELRKSKDEQEKAKLEMIRQQERDLLDTRSQPIRQYLMDNVVPHLTQGLIDLCKKVPNDPVDYLADFLLKKADEIDQQRLQEKEAALKAKQEAKLAKQR